MMIVVVMTQLGVIVVMFSASGCYNGFSFMSSGFVIMGVITILSVIDLVVIVLADSPKTSTFVIVVVVLNEIRNLTMHIVVIVSNVCCYF